MSESKITLNDGTKRIEQNRIGDTPIMEAFRKNPRIKDKDMRQLNKCRIFLKAFMLSDITSGDGSTIVTQAWAGVILENKTRDDSQWPIWGKPNTREWMVWRQALKITFCSNYERKLEKKLGDWIRFPKMWRWFILEDKGKCHLAEKNKTGWKIYGRIGRSNLMMRFRKEGVIVEEPNKKN